MRTSFPARTRLFADTALLSAVVACFAFTLHAQTLARPGWAGSGLSAEPWWRNAVLYRIDPHNFQDSDGDGVGDLRGVAQRLAYLQTLGVDAVVLEAPFEDSGFDELLEESGRHHIRLLVTVNGSDGATLLPRARQWLTRGVAGVWFRPAPGEQAAQLATEVHALRALADSFPGQRILVEDTSHDPSLLPVAGAELAVRALQIGTLGQGDDASLLRAQVSAAQVVPQGSIALLTLQDETPSTGKKDEHAGELRRVAATALFASRAAVAVEYGQELGLSTASGTESKRMRWTPSNVTRPAATVAPAQAAPQPPREDVYGAFVPYTPPGAEKPPAKHESGFEELPGFTSGKLPEALASETDIATNAAAEDADPASLLNVYRRLAQLHHGKAAFRAGAVAVLDHGDEGLMVLIRRPPPGDRTATAVVIACNITDKRLTVSLAADFAKLKIRGGYLHVLLASPEKETRVPQNTDSLVLASWGAVVAELEYE